MGKNYISVKSRNGCFTQSGVQSPESPESRVRNPESSEGIEISRSVYAVRLRLTVIFDPRSQQQILSLIQYSRCSQLVARAYLLLRYAEDAVRSAIG